MIKAGDLVHLKDSTHGLIDVVYEVISVFLEDGTIVNKVYGCKYWKIAGINTDQLEVIHLH